MSAGRRFARVIGELTIIVVGVLVALAADSWYQSRSERRELAGYLDRLAVDLEADSPTFQLVLTVLDSKDNRLDQVARVALGNEEPDSLFFRRLAGTQYMGFHTPGLDAPRTTI